MNAWPKTFSIAPPTAPKQIEADTHQLAAKEAYGIKLASGMLPFDAALAIVKDTGTALWVSQNWPNDPVVIKSKEIHLKTIALSEGLLDKNQLAAKALKIADDTNYEAKDRIAALALYGKIAGYTDKIDINNSTNTLKFVTLKFVKPDKKEEDTKIIEATPVKQEETVGRKIKLVAAS